MDNPDVEHPCNENCSCSTVSYDPVCAQNDVTYFTPCHAGCTDSNGTEVKGNEREREREIEREKERERDGETERARERERTREEEMPEREREIYREKQR